MTKRTKPTKPDDGTKPELSVVPRVGGPASGMPASGAPTRPPWPANNFGAVVSGHRSPRVYGELARLLTEGLIADRPDLAAYPEAVAAWATAEAQAALLRRHLDNQGILDDNGNPRQKLIDSLRHVERQALRHREVLGLDPRSEASLARDRAAASVLAVDLQALAERGRQALDARHADPHEAEPPDLAEHVLAQARERNAQLWSEAVANFRPDGDDDPDADDDKETTT